MMDLVGKRPDFSAKSVEREVQERLALKCRAIQLDSYIDQNFLIKTDINDQLVLKISNQAEKLDALNAQIEMVAFLSQKMPAFAFPEAIKTGAGEFVWEIQDSGGQKFYARLLKFIPGVFLSQYSRHSPNLLYNFGKFLGQMDRHLANFDHCGLHRELNWDLKNVLNLWHLTDFIEDAARRRLVEYFLLQFEMQVLPALPELRKSPIHNDANDFNVLAHDKASDLIKGIIDFGDCVYSYTIFELAIACTYAMFDKTDPLQAAAQVIRGYHQELSIERNEIELLYYLIAGRVCQSLINSAYSNKEQPDNEYVSISEKQAQNLLEYLLTCNPEKARREFLTACDYRWSLSGMRKEQILAKREKFISKSLSISYKKPLKIVQGGLHYLYDEQGRTYLDCVNNVPHVGHSHPRVVKAAQRQMAMLNTNTRYLHDYLVEYAEKLTAKFPRQLSVCFFVNSGSEANDLALRLARNFTGAKDIICIDFAYHGTTTAVIETSPYKFDGPGGTGAEAHIHKVDVPDVYRGKFRRSDPEAGEKYAFQVAEKIDELKKSRRRLAAFISETLMGVAGQIVFPQNYLKDVYRFVRDAGGLCIADEVQVGFGRVGTHFWGFETQQVVPDIVTLGKPIGNGHPLAAVVTTAEIADAFANGMEYFNTFGGNPVSCAVGLSVLEIIEKENLQENARKVGEYLRNKLIELMSDFSLIGDVRGMGLFLGIELVRDRQTLEPAGTEASEVVEKMKERGVLLSTDGPFHNVIKIKPPIIFQKKHADFLVENLKTVLTELSQ